MPLPEPLAPPVMLNQLAASVAVQLQPPGAVTVTLPVPPALVSAIVVGDTVNAQAAPASVTLTAWPATVNEAVCDVDAVFAAAEYVTVPLPEPLAPPVMLNQLAVSVAVQAQPPSALTVTLPVPPALVSTIVVGDTVNVHATPASVTLTAWPATVSVVVCDEDVVFAMAE